MTQERLYTSEFHNDVQYNGSGYWLHTVNEKLKGPARAALSSTVPKELYLGRQCTEQELKDIGYINLEPGVCHFVAAPNAPDGRRFDHAWLSAAEFEKLGLLDRLAKVREKMLHPEYQRSLHATMVKVRGKTVTEKRGTVYELGITVQKRPGRTSLQLGVIPKNAVDGENCDIITEITSIADAALKGLVPGMTDEFRARRQLQQPPLTIGADENTSITSIQLNFLDIDQGMEGLKKFGHGHVDFRDHPNMYTVLFFLGNPPPSYHPGFMALLGERTVCTTGALTAIIFSGKRWHTGIAPSPYPIDTPASLRYVSPVPIPELPEGTPLKRLAVVAYPNERMIDVHPQELGQELYTSAGRVCFQSQRKYQEWRMSYYIAREPEMVALEAVKAKEALKKKKKRVTGDGRYRFVKLDTKDIVRHTSPEYFVDKFQWIDETTGVVAFPSRQLAVDTMAQIGQGNEEWDKLSKDMQYNQLGRFLPGNKKAPIKKGSRAKVSKATKKGKTNKSEKKREAAEEDLAEKHVTEEEDSEWEETFYARDEKEDDDFEEPISKRLRRSH